MGKIRPRMLDWNQDPIHKIENKSSKNLSTICWHCAKAIPSFPDNDCEWALEFEPVPFWYATQDNIQVRNDADMNVYYLCSYCVHKCPKFKEG